jgi:hypothetical protein
MARNKAVEAMLYQQTKRRKEGAENKKKTKKDLKKSHTRHSSVQCTALRKSVQVLDKTYVVVFAYDERCGFVKRETCPGSLLKQRGADVQSHCSFARVNVRSCETNEFTPRMFCFYIQSHVCDNAVMWTSRKQQFSFFSSCTRVSTSSN